MDTPGSKMDSTECPVKGRKDYTLEMLLWDKPGTPVHFSDQKMDFTRCLVKGLKVYFMKKLFWDKSGSLMDTPGP